MYTMVRQMGATRLALLALGMFLLVLNTIGMFASLRNPDIYHEKLNLFQHDITLNEEQLRSALNSDASDRRGYLRKATIAVSQGIAHYWEDEGTDKYNLRIPARENYILYAASYICPKYFRKYAFVDHDRIIRRGIGMCGKESWVLVGALTEKHIKAKVVLLSGHIVVTAEVDPRTGKWWVLDPDYGVIVDHDMAEIEANPEIVRPYYAAVMRTYSPYPVKGSPKITIDQMVKIYDKPGNQTYNWNDDQKGQKWLTERLAYALKWLIPFCLMLPAAARFRHRGARSK